MSLFGSSLPGLAAAIPVEDVSTRPSGAAGAAQVGSAAPRPGQLSSLFYELQQLQQEVQQLRGQLEDQGYQLERLRQLQRQQYLDVDRRLAAAATAAQVPAQQAPAAGSSANVASAATTSGVVTPATSVPVPVPVVGSAGTAGSTTPAITTPRPTTAQPAASQKSEYTAAFELMKEQQFKQSIDAFQTILRAHPDGEYAANARYWLGELYLIEKRVEDAKASFLEVLEHHPAHQKVPDSLYKLGVAHHRLGSTSEALGYFDDVVNRYPDTPAAGLARTYAAELR